MIDPIARFASFEASKPPQGLAWSFLELGCGFGFVVDYASKVLGWQAHGIEPGGYGRIGSAALGVNIERQLLGQGSQFDGGRYDCIYASEVIEHVTNPDAFFKTCREHLSDRGVLILTTPVEEYISPQNQREEVYANLFPGEHKIIFSAAGLRGSLARAIQKVMDLLLLIANAVALGYSKTLQRKLIPKVLVAKQSLERRAKR